MKTLFFYCSLLFLFPFFTNAQNCLEIGTNFHFFGAGVYKNMKLSSSHFFTRNDIYREDENDWDSGLASTMAQDAVGYPLEITFPHPGNGNSQVGDYHIAIASQSFRDYGEWRGSGGVRRKICYIFINQTIAAVAKTRNTSPK